MFGCTLQPDSLTHYLRCPVVWPTGYSSDANDDSILERLVLLHPSRRSALDLVTNFLLYHSVRHCHVPLSPSALDRARAAAREHALTTAIRPKYPNTG